MNRVVTGIFLLGLVTWTTATSADELAELKERNARLEATVEELTLKLADAIRTQRALRGELDAARIAAENSSEPTSEAAQELETLTVTEPPQQRAVRNDCDVDAVLKRYRSSNKDNEQLRDWLRESPAAQQCEKDQLVTIREAVSWDFWGYSREVLAVIDKRLDQ